MTASDALEIITAGQPEQSEPHSPEAGPTVDRAWLHSFSVAVRTATLQRFSTVNSCILTTRIGLKVLDRVGVPARPAPVFVSVHNREAWGLSEKGVPVEDWPNSAHSVGIDERTAMLPNPKGWNGHLVLVVRQPGEPRLLIDLTADQFDRPIRNLVVGGPIFMDIPSGKPWTPQDPLFTTIGGRTQPDAVVSYRPMSPGHKEASRWKMSPDWLEEDAYLHQCVDQVLDVLAPPGNAIVQHPTI